MKKIKIIAIIGKAGAGKDFWLHKICEDNEVVHEIVSCTTRPARWMEQDGKNYHFLTEDQFLSEQFLESCMFRGWRYGTREKDVKENKINIGVFNLNGVETLLENPNIDLIVVYMQAEDRVRLIRQLRRDSSDINEIFRRYNTDNIDFDEYRLLNIRMQVPFYFVVNNTDEQYDENEFILQDFNEIIDEVKNK